MARILIQDGQTRDATFPARAGIESFRFKYRPALYQACEAYYTAARSGNAVEHSRATLELLCKHLESWDVEGPDGQPADCTRPALVARVPYPAIVFMVNAVTSYLPEEQAADAKNSSTGSASS